MKHTKKKQNYIKPIVITGVSLIVLILLLLPKTPPAPVTPSVDTGSTASICSTGWLPVCGEDGKTYANSCTAEQINKVKIAYSGQCKDVVKPVESTGAESIDNTETGSVSLESPIQTGSQNLPSLSEPEIPATSTIVVASTGSTQSGANLVPYYNTSNHYGFSLPKKSYYAGFGAQDGASHTVGITTIGTGVDSLSGSEVRVYFYRNIILPELKEINENTFTDAKTGTVYVLLDEKNSVKIESNNPGNAVVQAILETIHMGE